MCEFCTSMGLRWFACSGCDLEVPYIPRASLEHVNYSGPVWLSVGTPLRCPSCDPLGWSAA
jgi:hypothetical protein